MRICSSTTTYQNWRENILILREAHCSSGPVAWRMIFSVQLFFKLVDVLLRCFSRRQKLIPRPRSQKCLPAENKNVRGLAKYPKARRRDNTCKISQLRLRLNICVLRYGGCVALVCGNLNSFTNRHGKGLSSHLFDPVAFRSRENWWFLPRCLTAKYAIRSTQYSNATQLTIMAVRTWIAYE